MLEGMGGQHRARRSISGSLATVQTQVKTSQNVFQHRRRGQQGEEEVSTGAIKGTCRKWEPAACII